MTRYPIFFIFLFIFLSSEACFSQDQKLHKIDYGTFYRCLVDGNCGNDHSLNEAGSKNTVRTCDYFTIDWQLWKNSFTRERKDQIYKNLESMSIILLKDECLSANDLVVFKEASSSDENLFVPTPFIESTLDVIFWQSLPSGESEKSAIACGYYDEYQQSLPTDFRELCK